jgi:hypothetical protein
VSIASFHRAASSGQTFQKYSCFSAQSLTLMLDGVIVGYKSDYGAFLGLRMSPVRLNGWSGSRGRCD